MQIEADKIYLCQTLEDAEVFLEECDKLGIRWGGGAKATEFTNYDYGEDTCYRVNSRDDGSPPYLTYDSRDYYEDECEEEIVVYNSMTEEEVAAMDAAWQAMMQPVEQPK